MRKITITDRLRYKFDILMSKGQIALIGLLFLLTVGSILIAAIILMIVKESPGDWVNGKLFWQLLLRTIDPGTMAGDEGGWFFLFMMLAVTLGGIFIFSTLIGLLTTGIEDKLDQFRKGRSYVAEEDHIVILGWSSTIYTVLKQLVIANSGRKDSCITILSEKGKVEMEDEIGERVGDTRNTRIICRRGSPIDPDDLEIVNPHASRSIIILGPEEKDPDVRVIKTILALTNNPHRRSDMYQITAVIRDPNNLEAARLIGKDETQLLLAGNLIARIAAQSCRKPGLSIVYAELLDFSGNDVYFTLEPKLVGKNFGNVLLAYEEATVIGLYSETQGIRLNPPAETTITSNDALILLAVEKQHIRLAAKAKITVDASGIQKTPGQAPETERFLLLGWNQSAPIFISELDQYVGPDSELTVVAEPEDIGKYHSKERILGPYQHLKVTLRYGNTTDRLTLDKLAVQTYEHVVVLSYSDRLNPQHADAHTLVTLLHLRRIANEHPQHRFTIVSEMLDAQNRELAEISQPDDFIVSYTLISMLLTQVSQYKQRFDVYQELFTSEGSELYFKSAGEYVELGKPLTFYTVVAAARRRGDIAVGYRTQADACNKARQYGVKLNPKKSELVTFTKDDRIIVLAEH